MRRPARAHSHHVLMEGHNAPIDFAVNGIVQQPSGVQQLVVLLTVHGHMCESQVHQGLQ